MPFGIRPSVPSHLQGMRRSMRSACMKIRQRLHPRDGYTRTARQILATAPFHQQALDGAVRSRRSAHRVALRGGTSCAMNRNTPSVLCVTRLLQDHDAPHHRASGTCMNTNGSRVLARVALRLSEQMPHHLGAGTWCQLPLRVYPGRVICPCSDGIVMKRTTFGAFAPITMPLGSNKKEAAAPAFHPQLQIGSI